ncbi:hypothetical protein [Streptomyces vietnamensis]|uniref:DNA polymerase III beta sliding clamp central domain-containing protein n=1 Tax=Streptomyces vietnamensis TaxID=362257 RepID=A0A0B5IPU1_9ACTN|nr:hypothetical protein [Streptomyces vietnamensis]AJF70444.1 hypothetical protein SVTN_40470 [Streptomyces vietnamensis]
MPVAINAHQLGRMLSRTARHIGSEFVEPLHGIRLEADDTHLYAIASDRYTIAVARYRHHGLDGEPFARTVPASALRSLREWTDAQHGSDTITLTTAEGRLRLSAPHGELAFAVTDDQKFFDWRGVLHDVLLQDPAGSVPFPALDTRFLSRFADADDKVRVRTADGRATLIVGEDFLGAQTPLRSRSEGFGVHLAEDVEQVLADWTPTLTGARPVAMPDGIPAERRLRYEVTQDPAETVEILLRQTLRSTCDLFEEDSNSVAAAASHASSGVMAWSAYRFLDALRTADPKLAAQIVADVAEQLDSGEIGEFAADAASLAGHDPEKWREEDEARWAQQRAAAARKGATADGRQPKAPLVRDADGS